MSSLVRDLAADGRDVWLGNPIASWIGAAVGAVVGFAVVALAVHAVNRLVVPRAARSRRSSLNALAAALGAIRTWLLATIAIVAALAALSFPSLPAFWLRIGTFVLIGFQIVRCVNAALVTWLLQSARGTDGREVPVMMHIVTWAIEFVVWITFLLAALSYGGVHITAFVASLGVGGIAVALALQNILGDLFASVSIGLDKPFEPGDYIAFDTDQGTVKHVGIKSTRIQSLTGEELAIANSQLLAKLVHNYSRMPERRVVFGFTVRYDTDGDALRAIAEHVNAAIAVSDGVRFDRGHFTGFTTDGFTFEFVYYVLDDDYAHYLDIQQSINHHVIDILAEAGTSFAVPPRFVTVGHADRAGRDGPSTTGEDAAAD